MCFLPLNELYIAIACDTDDPDRLSIAIANEAKLPMLSAYDIAK